MKEMEERHPLNSSSSLKPQKSFVSRKVMTGLFTVISSVCLRTESRIIELPPNATRYDRLVNRFHESNELFDGTFNAVHNVLTTDVSTNEVYTYSQVMKQDDIEDFLRAMEEEVSAHEQCNHWTMVRRDNCHLVSRPFVPFGPLNVKDSPTDGLINTKRVSVRMEVCSNGGRITGRHILRSSICSASDYCWQSPICTI